MAKKDKDQKEKKEKLDLEQEVPPVDEAGASAQEEPAEGAQEAALFEEALKKLISDKETAEADRDKYLAIAQRSQADFDNYRRRNEAIGAQRYQDGMADTLEALLPVLDNFDRALASVPEDDHNKGLLEGVRMVQKQLTGVLASKGCTPMDTQPGTAFDPQMHNAMMMVPCDEGNEPGTIADTFQTGYVLNEKVLRHASVRVFE